MGVREIAGAADGAVPRMPGSPPVSGSAAASPSGKRDAVPDRPPCGPLAGLRVLETATLLPGPWAGLMLAELGAEVIKVEPPEGDPTRHYPPHRGGVGYLFLLANRGKRSVVLDLKQPAQRQRFLALARTADVAIDSWRPDAAARLGLTPDVLASVNPRLVTCSITGYGNAGPRRQLAGHDINYEAWAGVLALSGHPVTGPAVPAVQAADFGGGTLPAVVGILAALLERSRTGRGRHLDVAMAVGCVPLNVMALGLSDAGFDDPAPGDGPLTGGVPCFRVYRARTGWLAVGALEPKFWREFCRVLGLAEPFPDAFAVGERRDEVVRLVERCLAEADAEEWERRFRGVDTCVERVRSPREVLADPWLRAIGAIGAAPDPEGRPLATLRALPCWPDALVLGPAPALGEHTAAVLDAIPEER